MKEEELASISWCQVDILLFSRGFMKKKKVGGERSIDPLHFGIIPIEDYASNSMNKNPVPQIANIYKTAPPALSPTLKIYCWKGKDDK